MDGVWCVACCPQWKHGKKMRSHYDEDLWGLTLCTGAHSYKAKEVFSWKLHVMPQESCPKIYVAFPCLSCFAFSLNVKPV